MCREIKPTSKDVQSLLVGFKFLSPLVLVTQRAMRGFPAPVVVGAAEFTAPQVLLSGFCYRGCTSVLALLHAYCMDDVGVALGDGVQQVLFCVLLHVLILLCIIKLECKTLYKAY